jgi:tetratricopeptide (TPR) repeat protein
MVCLCAVAAAGAKTRAGLADARAEAMLNSPTVDAGLYSLGVNPAMLADLPSLQFGFTHKQFPAPSSTSELFGGAVPLGKYGTLAGGFGTVLVRSVERYNGNGELIGTYTYHEDRLAGGYALRPVPWFAAGAALNYDRHITGPEEDANYATAAGDVGLMLRLPEIADGAVTLAAGVQNLFSSPITAANGEEYRDPRHYAAGASWGRYFGNHRLTLTASGEAEDFFRGGGSAEVLISSRFAGRGGLTVAKNADEFSLRPALGAGFNTALFSFDYCFVMRELGDFHYVSVSVNPGRQTRAYTEERRVVKEWLAEGLAYFEAGSYARALDRFEAVLKYEPANEVAREHRVKSQYYLYLAEGAEKLAAQDWKGARGAFEDALALVPEDFLATEYLDRVNQLEEEDRLRKAEEERIAQKYKDAEKAYGRGNYLAAVRLCEEILAAHPDHAEAKELRDKAKRIYIATRPEDSPETLPETDVVAPTIPAEAVTAYGQANSLLSRGAVSQAISILSSIVSEYPTYGAARAKLVDAYLYRGLEYYSNGELSSALKTWRRAQALDPGNAKAKRYIERAESEIK